MAIIFEKKDGIAHITLNRPEVLNSLDLESLSQLSQALIEYRDDSALMAAIITGAGDKAFCTGADIKAMEKILKEGPDEPGLLPATIMRGLELWKPIIAAVNGMALGGGLELMLACDLRIASEKAIFGTPEVGIGIIPGWGGTQRLVRDIPRCKAAEILLLGFPIDAQEAYRIGLVNKVVAPAEVLPEAEKWAKRLCQVAPLAVSAAKEAMMRGTELSIENGLRLETVLATPLKASEDFKEGRKAFAEKRKPVFKAR